MDLTKEVQGIFKDYLGEVMSAADKVIPEVAKETAKKIKDTAPRRKGSYAKSWSVKTDKKRIHVSSTVYAKAPGYRLAHLLENGHAKRAGGRVQGIPHIAPAEEWAAEEVVGRLQRAMTI